VLKFHQLTSGLVMGGTNMKSEASVLRNGVSSISTLECAGANIVVATPGRLMDHLENTEGFMVSHLCCLVIDEADRILDTGFEHQMKKILRRLPGNRQSMLFSATKTKKVEDLAKLALKEEPHYIGVDDHRQQATVDGLTQVQ